MRRVFFNKTVEFLRTYGYRSFILLTIPFILLFAFNQKAEAHAFSASYTTIDLSKSQTNMTFALDEVSVMELTGGDVNKNGMLDPDEFNAIKDKIESIIKKNVVLKIDGVPQEWSKLNKIELNRKGDATQLILNIEYPAIQSSQSISLADSLYQNSNTSTTYVDLLKVNYGKETSTSALSDKNRTWSMILSDSEYAALSADHNSSQPVSNQSSQQNPKTNQHSTTTKQAGNSTNDWVSFLKLGMNHILTGYDHLLFLLSLLIARQSFKQFVKVITAFTIAHSITLTLTVLGIISVPSYIVEPAIAMSICYVAVENIFRKKISHRWVITFLFGLIHGMGFADLLTSMHLPKSDLAIDLASFNIGIEIIQLVIVVTVLPLLSLLHRGKHSRQAVVTISTIAFLLGGYWLIERIFS